MKYHNKDYTFKLKLKEEVNHQVFRYTFKNKFGNVRVKKCFNIDFHLLERGTLYIAKELRNIDITLSALL